MSVAHVDNERQRAAVLHEDPRTKRSRATSQTYCRLLPSLLS